MKKIFKDKRFSFDREETLRYADSIIDEYKKEGYELTLRQLYYQFVSKGLIENTERSYKNLGNLINDGRLAGRIDWGIVDRTRQSHASYTVDNITEALNNTLRLYTKNKMQDQDVYIEVWVEKEALAEVVSKACSPFAIRYMACKGYMSQSAMFEASCRFRKADEEGKECHLIYLGDHDPSGIDMSRDIQDRLYTFLSLPLDCSCHDPDGFMCQGCEEYYVGVEMHRVALNMEQIEKYQPPPNPAKLSDSRCKSYIEKYGQSSWELDALSPAILNGLITEKIETLLDMDTWNDSLLEEIEEKDKLEEIIGEIGE